MKFLYIILIISFPNIVRAQTVINEQKGNRILNSSDKSFSAGKDIIQKLNSFSENHAPEQTYLQFDKPYYGLGDTVYFKAYVTLGAAHKLSALSGVLHAELIGPDNKIQRSIALPLVAGTAWGDFTLADTLKSGIYRIRAYTRWMRNAGEDSFFEQVIPVGSPEEKKLPGNIATDKISSSSKINPGKPDVQFLPEGGSLIAGNYSKIAFKAVGGDGLGTDIKGTVTDDAGNEAASFSSSHLGMGSFNIVAEPGKTYKANIIYADGTKGTVELPATATSGYTISLNNSNKDTVRIRII